MQLKFPGEARKRGKNGNYEEIGGKSDGSWAVLVATPSASDTGKDNRRKKNRKIHIFFFVPFPSHYYCYHLVLVLSYTYIFFWNSRAFSRAARIFRLNANGREVFVWFKSDQFSWFWCFLIESAILFFFRCSARCSTKLSDRPQSPHSADERPMTDRDLPTEIWIYHWRGRLATNFGIFDFRLVSRIPLGGKEQAPPGSREPRPGSRGTGCESLESSSTEAKREDPHTKTIQYGTTVLTLKKSRQLTLNFHPFDQLIKKPSQSDGELINEY